MQTDWSAIKARVSNRLARHLYAAPLALSGKTRPATGALPGAAREGPLQPLVPRAVEATCVDGVLMVTPSPALALQPLPGGSMHYHDMALFYADIRSDVVRRVSAFLAAEAPPGRAGATGRGATG